MEGCRVLRFLHLPDLALFAQIEEISPDGSFFIGHPLDLAFLCRICLLQKLFNADLHLCRLPVLCAHDPSALKGPRKHQRRHRTELPDYYGEIRRAIHKDTHHAAGVTDLEPHLFSLEIPGDRHDEILFLPGGNLFFAFSVPGLEGSDQKALRDPAQPDQAAYHTRCA